MAEKDNTKNRRISLRDFPPETLKDVKRVSDQVSGNKEWLGHMYLSNGKIVMGQETFGDYNGITIEPQKQMQIDKGVTGVKECMLSTGENASSCKNVVMGSGDRYGARDMGADPEDLISTIHCHPMKSASEYDKRKYFSGIDIGSEFAKSRNNDETVRLLLTYPRFTKTSKRHNMVKMITFPGNSEVMSVMKSSNPHLSDEQVMSVDQDGRNINLVDWGAYQDEAERRGQIEVLDIEQETGMDAYATQANSYVGVVIVGTALVLGLAWYLNRRKKQKAKSL